MNIPELVSIIKQCGDILLKYRNSPALIVETKEDGSKVTNVDKEVNEILQNYLKDKYPTYGIMSEEMDKECKEYTWHIDPLNGTGAYLKGNDYFDILVGLVRENKPILGLIYHPLYNRMYVGGENEIPRVITKDKESKLVMAPTLEQNLLFAPSENWENVFKNLFNGNPKYTLIHRDELGEEFKDPRIHIIEGGLNLEINSNFGAWGPWDICPGHAILSCFGGIMTDYYGKDIDYSHSVLNDGFIAADRIERIKNLEWLK
jgi:3'(2'), 5'-bisphosphate nucleotidase